MAKYLNQELVCKSFERLSSRNTTGKTHLERTSVLMYFLSIDATFKYFGESVLDLNPDSSEGINRRRQVELQFTKLVLVGTSHLEVRQVIELGKIEEAGTHPEKRISSNFLTVPLKKATTHDTPFYYPSRPKYPLFKMGPAATGKKWGVSFHDNWMTNFVSMLTTIKGATPSFDLAVFACRDCAIEDRVTNIYTALEEQLKRRFTRNLADFWVQRIEKEKIMARVIPIPFADHYTSFANFYKQAAAPVNEYEQMNKSELIDRIRQLESMLEISE